MGKLAAIVVLCVSQVAFAALPAEWFMTGKDPAKFDVQKQPNGWDGNPMVVLSLKNPTDKGWATPATAFRADRYRGKRVRFTARVKTDSVTAWASLWLRVDGPPGAPSLAFDNMSDRQIKGTTPWTQYQIVLDVPDEAREIVFGFMMEDGGVAFFSAPTFEVVGNDVPTTGTKPGAKPRMEPQLDLNK